MNGLWGHKKIGEILISNGACSRAELDLALGGDIVPVGQALLQGGSIDDEDLAKALAIQSGLEYISLDSFVENQSLFEHINQEYCLKFSIIPIRYDQGLLSLATANPFDLKLSEQVERICKLKIRYLVGAESSIFKALDRVCASDTALKGVSEKLKSSRDHESKHEGRVDTASESNPIVELINKLITEGVKRRVSDIHIEPHEQGVSVRYRVDGILTSALGDLSLSHHNFLVTRLKVMADLDTTERKVSQDGRFKQNVDGREVDFRISILPSSFGESVVIRILDKMSLLEGDVQLDIRNLGFDGKALTQFRRRLTAPYGMILISGPTGSGKTTTLYAGLNELDLGKRKVVTIEDPIEYQLKGVVQIPVNEKKNFSFSRGLRSVLRHDPDVVMVGEIRDAETAEIAVQAALTGHLILSTIHANSALDVIPRLHHMGIDMYDLVSVLDSVTAQRLMRRLCPICKEEYEGDKLDFYLSEEEMKHLTNQVWYTAKGCKECGESGYKGRLAITEIMQLTSSLREAIIQRESFANISTLVAKEGMISLRQVAIERAREGETTLEEVARVTYGS